MIWESYPWRQELCEVASRLSGWKDKTDWDDEQQAFEVERDVMVSAYAIRKLLDAQRIPDSIAEADVRVLTYPLISRVPDLFNWDKIDEHYDFTKEEVDVLPVRKLCDQFIHSFIWMREGAADHDLDGARPSGLTGIYFASDHARHRHLFRIDVDSLIDLFQTVGIEEVMSMHRVRDATGQWVVVSSLTGDEAESGESVPRTF